MAYDAANRMSCVVNLISTNTTPWYFKDAFDRIRDRCVHDGKNVLPETAVVGTVEAEFTYVTLPYVPAIRQRRSGDSSFQQFDGTRTVAISLRREESFVLNGMMPWPTANL